MRCSGRLETSEGTLEVVACGRGCRPVEKSCSELNRRCFAELRGQREG